MKQSYAALIFILFFTGVIAQTPNGPSRSALNPALYPFYHGVASGDPLSDRVILWTRITLDPPVDPVPVSWQIATDTGFVNIVNNGNTTTDSTQDYTVKIDAVGLQQHTWYYYRFIYDTLKSVIGRTRTLPTGTVTNLRFAIASCQDYQEGFYNAHRHISQRNDIDAVLFLGDYTYEGPADVAPIGDRFHVPNIKTVQLVDYRTRQSLYHLDADLQEAHRQYPWICVWDDHETTNNSYEEGAKSHAMIDGSWYDRKVNAVETYKEWLPVRMPDLTDTFKIFRRFTWGNLADLNMLDTRLYERDQQIAPTAPLQFVSTTDSLLLDTTRNMLGPQQFDWLKNNLTTSTAQWQIIGQQVMMAPLTVPPGLQSTPIIVNPDQWDGYPYDRQRFYNHIINNNIQNVVVLTGDIHTSWANDLPLANYDTLNRQKSAGVEFICTSITSNNEMDAIISAPLIQQLAQHVRYVDITRHGYSILDITPSRTQCDFNYVSTVASQTFTTSNAPSWYVNNGERFLRSANTASVAQNTFPVLAPGIGLQTSIANFAANLTTISVHPNPFYDEVIIQFNAQKAEPVLLEVYNSAGKLMLKNSLGTCNTGLNHAVFNGNSFASGFYTIKLTGTSAVKSQSLIKIN